MEAIKKSVALEACPTAIGTTYIAAVFREKHPYMHLVGAPLEPIEKTLYAVERLVSVSDEATMFP
jgi:hypothetical protein